MNTVLIKWAFIGLFVSALSARAQVNPWHALGTGKASTTHKGGTQASYGLDTDLLLTTCLKAPERTAQKASHVRINFPDRHGAFREYTIYRSRLLHPTLAEKYPGLHSFVGRSQDGAQIHFTYSSTAGLHGYFGGDGEATRTIAPSSLGNLGSYVVAEANAGNSAAECQLEQAVQKSNFSKASVTARNANDGYLRKYRLAVSTTGEYAQYFLDGTEANDAARKEKVLAAIMATMARVNMVFERDFAVTMELIANNDELIYLYDITDPYTIYFNSELQTTLDTTIGTDAYDIGHVFVLDGAVYGNAGCIACVCTDGRKGSAFSAHYAPETEGFNLLVMHEMGHQFGGYHVQGSPDCRSGLNSEVEPGSGSTIMSYAGICFPNVQLEPDDYFNYVNIRDVAEWTIEDSKCAELIAIGNEAPTADAGEDYVIPPLTPFRLEGEATDPDGSEGLTYCWEQNDPGLPPSTGTPQGNWRTAAVFRSWEPSNHSFRYFPRLEDVLENNLKPTWEVLPSVSRTLNFAFTVRDNDVEGGQTASDEMKVTVLDIGDANPFFVTSPKADASWESGSAVTVEWDAYRTNEPPINVHFVSIYLSLDGGDFDFPLLENTPNDGSETFVLPASVPTSSKARVMVKAVDNIFFALNPAYFATQAADFAIELENEAPADVCIGETLEYRFTYRTFLDFSESTDFAIENLPEGVHAVFSPSTVTGQQQEGLGVVLELTGVENIPLGAYEPIIVGTSPSIVKREPFLFDLYGPELAAPVLEFPADSEVGILPDASFQWEPLGNAQTYQIDIALDAGFVEMVDSQTVEVASYISDQLELNTHYYYRVKGMNTCGEGAYSPAREFITACPEPSNFEVIDTGPSHVELRWEGVHKESWDVEYGPSGFSPGAGTVVSVMENTLLLEGLESSSQYDFYVRATCGLAGDGVMVGPVFAATSEDFCAGDRFYDSGGPDGDYGNWEDYVKVVAPSSPGQRVRVQFNAFQVENCCDYLIVYDGDSTSDPLLGAYNGSNTVPLLKSTHESGALTFLFRSDGFGTYSGWDATVTCEPQPTCAPPTEIVAESRDANTIVLSWTSTGEVDQWEVEYGPSGFALGEGTIHVADGNATEIGSLEPTTEYQFYLRSVCGDGTTSDESEPITATTPCAIFEAPFNEPFPNSREVPECWSNTGEGNWQFGYSSNNHGRHGRTTGESVSGGVFAFIDDSHSQGSATLQSPFIDISSLEDPGLSFFMNSHNEGGANVDFSVDVFDGTQWLEGVFRSSSNTLGWQRVFVDLSFLSEETEVISVRFIANDSDGSSIYDDFALDDVRVDDFGGCYPPTIMEHQVISSTESITLEWTPVGTTATEWEVEYGESGFVIGTGTVLTTGEMGITLTELDSDTEYHVYVRAVCGTQSSNEREPYVIGTKPDYCAGDRFYDSGGPYGDYYNEDYTETIFPENEGDRVRVNFLNFSLTSGDYLIIYDGPDEQAPLLGEYTGYLDPFYLSSSHESGALTFVFSAIAYYSNWGWEAEVVCEARPGCAPPMDGGVENVEADQITLSWTASNEVAQWEVEYGPQGFLPGYGITVVTDSATTVVDALEPNTEYWFYLRSVCQDGTKSNESGPITAKTACANLEAPFYESFSYNRNLPECWSNAGERSWQFNYYSDNHGRGERTTGRSESAGVFAYVDASSTPGTAVLESPPIDITSLEHPALSFYMNSHNEGGANLPFSVDVLDGTEWVEGVFASSSNTLGWQRVFVDLSFLSEDTEVTHIRFVAQDDKGNSLYDDFALDDVRVDDFGNCYAPMIMEDQVAVTTDSITLEWSPVGNGAMEWQVEYGLRGFIVGTGTTVSTNDMGIALTQLDSYTEYDVYVRPVCGNGGSETGPMTIRTNPDYCAGDWFYDSGGPFEDYFNNEKYLETIFPTNEGDRVRVRFVSFYLGNNDYLRIYDGPDENAPLLGEYTGYYPIGQFFSTHDSGALTFAFSSDRYSNYRGWEAEVVCEPKPNCPAPSSLEALYVSDSAVQLQWEENGMAQAWTVEYGDPGFAPGDGITVQADSNPFTLSGLAPRTNYDVYITSFCGAGEGVSDSTSPLTIATPCSPLTAPYLESFERYWLPTCWEDGPNNKEDWTFDYYGTHVGNNGQIAGATESGGIFAFVDDSPEHHKGTTLDTPLVDVSEVANPGLTFYLLSDNEGGENVEFSVDVFDGSKWNPGVFRSNENTYEWIKIYVDFSELTITGPVKARFVVDEIGEGDTDDLAIDDVFIGEVPSCPPPHWNEAAAQSTTSSIAIDWIEVGQATSWMVEYGAQGFELGTGNQLILDTTEALVDGLQSGTHYDIYLYSVCGDTDSMAIEPLTIKTEEDYCAGDRFYDPGGPTGGYSNNESFIETIFPQIPGTSISVEFLSFELEQGFDILYVFEGPDTSTMPIGSYTGSELPPTLTSTHASGALTFWFLSDSSRVYAGWEAVASCEALPVDTFQISSYGESCRMANDGSITIGAMERELQYRALLNGGEYGDEITFTDTANFTDLEAGTYDLCITIDGSQDFEQCYSIVIGEPEDIAITTSRMADARKFVLEMSGGQQYWVTLNGKEISTRNSRLELDLEVGANHLVVRSDKDCQGMYEETIFVAGELMVYPNPVGAGPLKIVMPKFPSGKLELRLYTINGKMVRMEKVASGAGEILWNLDGLPNAIYLLRVSNTEGTIDDEIKIVKE